MTDSIYADYNATTPLDGGVIDAITASLRDDWGNPSSSHVLGRTARSSVEEARGRVARLVGGLPEQITFASGGTEVNNMVIFGACSEVTGIVPHIITSNVEHDSIELPLKHLESAGRAIVTRVKVKDGQIDAQDVINAIIDDTVLITVMAANNETGVLMPLQKIGIALKSLNAERGKQPHVYFHSDGAQIIGKEKMDVIECHLDYFTIVGHKFYGPRIAALWSRVKVVPLLYGGGQEGGIRPGTENTPMIVGLGVAAQLLTDNLVSYRSYMKELRQELEYRLKGSDILKGIINCEGKSRLVNTVNVSFPDFSLKGNLILKKCKRVMAGVGAACHLSSGGSAILLKSGVTLQLASTAIRLSLGRQQPQCEIKQIVDDLEQAVLELRKCSQTAS